MTNLQKSYPRINPELPELSIEEIKERSVKYVRNVVLGLRQNVDLPKLKNWLRMDCRLLKLPPDAILMRWLVEWDEAYLAKWSHENDPLPESN